MKKRFVSIMILGTMVTGLFMGCGASKDGEKLVDEKCWDCGNSPAYQYETDNGEYSYICEECKGVCFWCGEKTEDHYTTAAGDEAYMCEECIEEMR
ncbi:MAG: hypothetical protein ACI4HI_17955 [Lachnospiraceae bacterium]